MKDSERTHYDVRLFSMETAQLHNRNHWCRWMVIQQNQGFLRGGWASKNNGLYRVVIYEEHTDAEVRYFFFKSWYIFQIWSMECIRSLLNTHGRDQDDGSSCRKTPSNGHIIKRYALDQCRWFLVYNDPAMFVWGQDMERANTPVQWHAQKCASPFIVWVWERIFAQGIFPKECLHWWGSYRIGKWGFDRWPQTRRHFWV